MTRAPRSDAERNRTAVLVAADELFASAAVPARVTMDDVAAAAGVGKGTLFRAFGSRAGLVQAIWAKRSEPLRHAIESGPPPLGPATEPAERIAAILDAIVDLKLANRHLMLSVEERLADITLYEQPQYQVVHGLLRDLLIQLGHDDSGDLLAHVLLAVVRADLLFHLSTDAGLSRQRLRSGIGSVVDLVLAAPGLGAAQTGGLLSGQ